MARVASLGIHTPTAFPYCFAEKILSDPQQTTESYDWTIGESFPAQEELLVTRNSVVWSQGGVVRRVFNYDIEEEPVVQAILTWFPSNDPLDAVAANQNSSEDDYGDLGSYLPGGFDPSKRKPAWEETTSKKRPNWNPKIFGAHLGEFSRPHDASDGVDGGDNGVAPGRARALVVFLKTLAYVYFLSGTQHVIHLPFEIERAFPGPKGLILERKQKIPTLLRAPLTASFRMRTTVTTTFSPRLFTLTDPLSEMGLVMTDKGFQPEQRIIYISPFSEVDLSGIYDPSTGKPLTSDSEVIIAVTHNDKFLEIWQVGYVPQDQPTKHHQRTPSASGTQSRRRSSFGPGTGATTPVAGISASASIGRVGRDSVGPADITLLGEEFGTGSARRSSRRVSSMVARADLSGNHDAAHRFSESIGASFGGPPAPQNTMVMDEQPVEKLLNGLNMRTLEMDKCKNDGLALKTEVLMHHLNSFGIRSTKGAEKLGHDWRVFTLQSPTSEAAAETVGKEKPGRKVAIFICDRVGRTLTQNILLIEFHQPKLPKGYPKRPGMKNGARVPLMGYTAEILPNGMMFDIVDAIKIEDGGIQKVLTLNSDGKFTLVSPWGGNIEVQLPVTLSRWNPNVVGEDGSRRGSLKKDYARTLSTSPSSYQRFYCSEPGGHVSVVDDNGTHHKLLITLAPRDSSTKICLETLRIILGASINTRFGEAILIAWMTVVTWLQTRSDPEAGLSHDHKGTSPEDEWKAFVVTLFILGVQGIPLPKASSRRKSAFVRSASMVAERDWEDIISHEGEWGSAPEYLRTSPWDWMVAEEDEKQYSKQQQAHSRNRNVETPMANKFITDCVSLARDFSKGPEGHFVGTHLFSDVGTRQGEVTGDDLARCLGDVLMALQLLREEWKLDIAMEGPARRLCPVLRQMALWIGWKTWAEDYLVEDVEMFKWSYDDGAITYLRVFAEPFPPPDILLWLKSCLEGNTPPPFMAMQDIVPPVNVSERNTPASQRPRNPFSPPPAPSPLPLQKPVFAKLTPRTRLITTLFSTLATPGATYVDVVEKMVELKFTLAHLQRLPEGVGVPLREVIARCQEQPPSRWNVEALDLVGRKDLRMLIEPSSAKKEFGSKWHSARTHQAKGDDVGNVCAAAFMQESPGDTGPFDPMAEQDRQAISDLLFQDDRRIQEATKLLRYDVSPTAKCLPEAVWNDHEKLEKYREIVNHVAMRTLATPPGDGLFHFSSRVPLLTERFPSTSFALSCVIKPANLTVTAEKSLVTEEKIGWAHFHTGVASGVSISRDAKEIDTSWIVFNKPAELTNRHGGFLLGLGLNGHLKCIAKWHAFNYLTPKHTMVSIGLLLGMSASFLGTMDATVTRLLSVHVTRLLPPGSAELNISPLTQTAGIMGIGLLYSNTQHRRMSEVMLSEIEFIEEYDSCVPADTLRDEGYRLAAGFALGFINMGSGSHLRGLHDMHLVERLLAMAVGPQKVSIVHILDRATAGATIALALIYMKTGDETVARKIDVPETVHLLDYVRPDLFLLRTVARNLIMWDGIAGTFKWIQSRLKPFHRDRYMLTEIVALDSEDLAFYNIIAGLCFSIALRHAGSGNEDVRDVLLHYLDQFIRLSSILARNHDQRLTRTTVRNCQDLLALSAATVMAGTGDVPVFRRLRRLHGRLSGNVTYGSHLAAHLAMGVIFLGSGSFTFGTSNLAIASLLCAFYPLFPNTPMDNKSHLQAFRHLWVLAVENRCIIPRDVDTLSPTRIPITITLKNGHELSRIAPCLLPEISTVVSVTTTSPQHWTVVLDLLNSEAHRAAFDRSQSIFVHRRSAHASQSTVFQAGLLALDGVEQLKAPLEWIGNLPCFSGLDKAEKALIIREGETGGAECVDDRLELEDALRRRLNRSRLKGVAIVAARKESEGGLWISNETVENIRAGIWVSGGD